MFDGVPADQFHQFITPTRTSPSSLPLHHHHHHHLPFPTTLHPSNTNANTTTNNNNTTFPPPFVDPYNHHNNPSHHHHHHQLITNNLLHPAAAPLHPPHHHSSSSSSSIVHNNHEEKEENNNNTTTLPMMNNFEIDERDRQINRRQHQQLPELIDPWSNEEVLTLLRIRSTMDSTWFPELTCWEHVSRKMAEFGYKRSAEKCKEKFEEESRYFNNINNNNNNYGKSSSSSYNNNRFLSELEELYHHHQEVVESEKNHHHQNNNNPSEGQEEGKIIGHHALLEGEKEEDGGSRKVNVTPAAVKEKENDEEEIRTNNNKRKRGSGGGGGRFEMFKGFCERIVHKMMEQQEEMHNKLIEDMVRWDEEKFAREEAWKRQEIEKMNKELEIMAQEQATAGNRHAGIIDFLRKFYPEINQGLGIIGTSDSDNGGRDKLVKVTTNNVSGSNTNLVTAAAAATSASSELHSHQNPNPSTMENSPLQQTNSSAVVTLNPIQVAKENPSSSGGTHPAQDTLLQVGNKNPSSSSSLNNDPNPIETNSVVNKAISNRVVSTTTITGKDDIGRRWPKDEVLALINLRCTTQNNNNNNNEDNNNTNNNNNNKAPLWERISQGMLELGYKRSAKRCKEKWENINKYFRKTKDNVNKKRSLDSRTCPYFHYLSNLYSQGKVVLQSPPPPKRQQEIVPASMHRISSNPEVNNNSQANNNNNHGNVVVRDGIRNQTQLVDETSSSQVGSGGGGGFSVQQQQEVDHGGEKTLMQVPSLEFDQF